MKEIEILVQVFADENTVLQKLSEFEFLGDKRTVDTYYYDPLRPELQPDGNGRLYACCRTRQKDGVNYITYKNDHFDGDTWLYSDEAETTVADMSTMCEIMHALGLRELIKIDNLGFAVSSEMNAGKPELMLRQKNKLNNNQGE